MIKPWATAFYCLALLTGANVGVSLVWYHDIPGFLILLCVAVLLLLASLDDRG
jgi:hypothetical protein